MPGAMTHAQVKPMRRGRAERGVRRRPSQRDIAKALGLSASTVSLVVGGSHSHLRSRLSEETVRRIQGKAEELGYIPNGAAQTMRRGQTNLIVLLNMGGYSEVCARQAYHVGREVREAGFDFQNVDAFWWSDDGQRIVEQVLALHPLGIILTGAPQTKMDFARFERAHIPVVAIGPDFPGVRRVLFNIHAAFRTLTEHCITTGRRRIALLLGASNNPNFHSKERKSGFLEALAAHGWPTPATFPVGGPLPSLSSLPPEAPFACIFERETRFQFFDYFSAGRKSAAWFGTFPDAIICANDFDATGVLSWMLQNGVRVPEEVAVSGFDNYSFATEGAVSLTTVAQPNEELSVTAVRLLNDLIAGNARQEDAIEMLPCKVLWRQSLPAAETHPGV